MSFLEPDPVLLWAIFFNKFVYLEILAGLALVRVILGHGPGRWPALIALLLALAALATIFAPAVGLNSGPLYVQADSLMRHGGGLTALLVPSAFLALSGFIKTAKTHWLDAIHFLMLAVLFGLTWYAA
ncbi:hypothetical protein [Pacificoceanicola onchidii]|uniref:hypothetical protein n=1 Tax=Pacificoceanicola onchidii TaxID=2562685 RepID=UPI0010A3A9F1|nr:hypothetical protein [Pacificoceanicola onchidii]